MIFEDDGVADLNTDIMNGAQAQASYHAGLRQNTFKYQNSVA